jgi:hypothetical protein
MTKQTQKTIPASARIGVRLPNGHAVEGQSRKGAALGTKKSDPDKWQETNTH